MTDNRSEENDCPWQQNVTKHFLVKQKKEPPPLEYIKLLIIKWESYRLERRRVCIYWW